jgi:hypothetical protein
LHYAATVTPGAVDQATSLTPADGVVAKVKTALATKWNLTVEQSSWTAGVFSSNFDVTLEILVDGSGYGKLSDVESVIDGSWYNDAGATVQSSRIVDVTPAGSAAATATGAPPASSSGNQNAASPFSLSTTAWIVIGVVAIAFALIAVIVFSPGTPARVAGSFAGGGR